MPKSTIVNGNEPNTQVQKTIMKRIHNACISFLQWMLEVNM